MGEDRARRDHHRTARRRRAPPRRAGAPRGRGRGPRRGAHRAWADALILAGSLLAQALLDNKKLETWAVWAVVNVFAIVTYARSDLHLVALQYVFFLANTAIGWRAWARSVARAQGVRAHDGAPAHHRAPRPRVLRSTPGAHHGDREHPAVGADGLRAARGGATGLRPRPPWWCRTPTCSPPPATGSCPTAPPSWARARRTCRSRRSAGAPTFYLFTPSTIPFEQDPLRYGGTEREGTDLHWLGVLARAEARVAVLEATSPEGRLAEAVAAVQQACATKAARIAHDRRGR